MTLEKLVDEVLYGTGVMKHEAKMLTYAAERYARLLGFASGHVCPRAAYELGSAERETLIDRGCADLSPERRRQVGTLVTRLLARGARLGFVDAVAVDAPLARAGDDAVVLRYPYVGEDGALPAGSTFQDVESALFVELAERAMRASRTQAEAARKLGMSKSAFQRRLVRSGLYF